MSRPGVAASPSGCAASVIGWSTAYGIAAISVRRRRRPGAASAALSPPRRRCVTRTGRCPASRPSRAARTAPAAPQAAAPRRPRPARLDDVAEAACTPPSRVGERAGCRRRRRADRVQPELELGDDAEVAAAAAQRPREIALVVARLDRAPSAIDHRGGRARLSHGQAEAREPADAAAEREPRRRPSPTRARRRGAGHAPGSPRRASPAVTPAPRRTRCAAGSTSMLLHRREVDHQAAVDDGVRRPAVAAAAHGDRQALARGRTRRAAATSLRADAAGDQRRPRSIMPLKIAGPRRSRRSPGQEQRRRAAGGAEADVRRSTRGYLPGWPRAVADRPRALRPGSTAGSRGTARAGHWPAATISRRMPTTSSARPQGPHTRRPRSSRPRA